LAEVVPFPLVRRRDLIMRQAQWFAEQSRSAAERNLRRQVHVQRETLLRRGIPPEVVEQQCAEMEAAIRAAAWRFGSAC
jgi:hypothetical protein